MKFIIIHGAFGGPSGNWFKELKDKLLYLDQEVIAPQFPVDSWQDVTKNGPEKSSKNQSLNSWFSVFEKEILTKIKKNEKVCFIAHSLGPLFVLHVVQKYHLKIDSAIFVSPFLDILNKSWQIDHVNKTFYKTDFDFDLLKKLIPVSYILYSDNDPYVDKKHSLLFANALESSIIFVKRAGHMNSEVNMNEFPLVFDLCLTRLDLNLYQKYLIQRKDLLDVEILKNKKVGIIELKFSEAPGEGKFHFRNLKKYGFATFYTKGLKFWNSQSRYMLEARNAAKKVKDFTRVFMLNSIQDIDNKSLFKQITLDLGAGIKCYFCLWSDVEKVVEEPDFGIWDYNYICIVHYDKNRKTGVTDIVLDSRDSEMLKFKGWAEYILKESFLIDSAGMEKSIRQFKQLHSNS